MIAPHKRGGCYGAIMLHISMLLDIYTLFFPDEVYGIPSIVQGEACIVDFLELLGIKVSSNSPNYVFDA